jgi:predicted P-loop ATPase
MDRILRHITTDRQERAQQIDAVRWKLVHPADARETAEDGSVRWVKGPKRLAANLQTILAMDPLPRHGLRFNSFTGQVEWQGEALTDVDLTRMQVSIYHAYQVEFSIAALHQAAAAQAADNPYHPVQQYLQALRWDGQRRLDRLLIDYAGAESTILNQTLARRFAVGAVARAMVPGCKVDTVLVLAGKQGIGKSTFFRTLCGADWFSDNGLDLRNKDAAMQIQGVWIYELAELASTRIRDAETVKAFVTRQVDQYRPPYARTTVRQPRQVVFVGSTNQASWLNDQTGSRRFWPVKVEREADIAALASDRDQLWAEAYEAWHSGSAWHLTRDEAAQLREAQEQYQSRDPWWDRIAQWVDTRAQVTVAEVLTDCIQKDRSQWSKADEMRVGGVLQGLGWVKKQRRIGGRRRAVVWVSESDE